MAPTQMIGYDTEEINYSVGYEYKTCMDGRFSVTSMKTNAYAHISQTIPVSEYTVC